VDIVGVYLKGTLDKDIYMKVLKGVENLYAKGRYWKLKKALYGLKQAGHQWKKQLHKVLIRSGFLWAFFNNYLYVLCQDNKILLIILVYIDDIAIVGPDTCKIILLKNNLNDHFEITNVSELKHILGLQVTHDHFTQMIYLDQSAYIQHLVL